MRKLHVVLMIWLMAATAVVAESSVETVAVGSGPTYQDALAKALRNAAESAAGVIVASSSTMERGKLQDDRAATASAGHVRAYEVLSHDLSGHLVRVTIKAQVDRWPIGKPLIAPIEQSPLNRTGFIGG